MVVLAGLGSAIIMFRGHVLDLHFSILILNMSDIGAQKTAPSLKRICQDDFISRVTQENSVDILILADTQKGYMEPVKEAAILMILDNGDEFLKREKLVARLKEVPDLYFEVFARAVSDRNAAPHLTVDLVDEGIKLFWTYKLPASAQGVVQYELQGRLANSPHEDPSPWKTFSLLEAVPLPMKCVLGKKVGKTCYFRVRGISKNGAMTGWSDDVSVTVN